jgi:hypothetical protein
MSARYMPEDKRRRREEIRRGEEIKKMNITLCRVKAFAEARITSGVK